jgi:hypothetical protein
MNKVPNLDDFKNIYLTAGERTCRHDLFDILTFLKKN